MGKTCVSGSMRAARRLTAVTLACLALASILMSLRPARAQSGPNPILEATGFQPTRAYSGEMPFERIDTLSGNLILRFTDLVLPGNGGASLTFERAYNSKGGWSFGIAGLPMRIEDPERRLPLPGEPHDPPWGYPKIFTYDGGSEYAEFMEYPQPNNPSLEEYRAATRWTMTRSFARYDREDAELYLPDGTLCFYDNDVVLGGTHYRKLTRVQDRFGNTIDIEYDNERRPWRITQSLGNNQSRVVTLSYAGLLVPPATQGSVPSQMNYLDRAWVYSYSSTVDTVQLPEGNGWTFQKDGEITSITTPHGGVIGYEFDWHLFEQDFGQYYNNSRVVTRRCIGSCGSSSQVWNYSYGLRGETTITAPNGVRTIFTYQGLDTFGFSHWDGWKLLQRLVMDGSTELEREDLTYEWVNTPVPVPKTRVVTRGGRTYHTEYTYSTTNFADYQRPAVIRETGDRGDRPRITTRSYYYDFDAIPEPSRPNDARWILGKLSGETVDVGGQTRTRSWEYDSTTGFLTKEVTYGVVTEFDSTPEGNVAWSRDGEAHQTNFQYSWGQPSLIDTPEYDVTRTIHPSGTTTAETRGTRTTSFEYDKLSRLTKQTPPSGSLATDWEYSTDGSTVTLKRGTFRSVTTLDGFGRPIATVDSKAGENDESRKFKTTTSYDAEGRVSYKSYPFKGNGSNIGTTLLYDGLGRIRVERNPDGSEVEYTYRYESSGLVVDVEDAQGRTSTRRFESFGNPDEGRLVSVTGPAPNNDFTWTYEYNTLGRLTRVNQPGAPPRSWEYNDKNQLTDETHPESGTTQYRAYDAAGNLGWKLDARGVRSDYTYDGNNRLTTITTSGGGIPGSSTAIDYEDDSDNREQVEVSVGGASRVRSEFSYDGAGRMWRRIDRIRRYEPDGAAFTTEYQYNGYDKVDAIIYPSGRTVSYDYDEAVRLEAVLSQPLGQSNVLLANEIQHHPSGAITSYRTSDGSVHRLDLDPQRYWPSYVESRRNNDVLFSSTLSYRDPANNNPDYVGNVRQITETRSGGAASTQTFRYDALDRLERVEALYANPLLFLYDPHGNRIDANGTRYWTDASTLRLMGQGASETNRTDFTYDAVGNLKSRETETFDYDANNMMIAATDGSRTVTYDYDGDALRTSRLKDGTRRYYLHDANGRVLAEYRQGSTPKLVRDYIYLGSRLLAAISPNLCPGFGVTLASSHTQFDKGDSATLTATVSGTQPSVAVDFLKDGEVIGTVNAAPYVFVWNESTPGVYSITARARTTGANPDECEVMSNSIAVTVINVGRVQTVTVIPTPIPAGFIGQVELTGENPCSQVTIDFGDGAPPSTHEFQALPTIVTHAWPNPGDFTVRVVGQGVCRGDVSIPLHVGPSRVPIDPAFPGRYFADLQASASETTYLIVDNPHAVAATARITYTLPGGFGQVQELMAPSRQRIAVDLASQSRVARTGSFSAAVQSLDSALPLVVEHVSYRTPATFASGRADQGAIPAPTWYLAEGAANSFFEETITVWNVTNDPVDVTLEYLPTAGSPVTETYRIEQGPGRVSLVVSTSLSSHGTVVTGRTLAGQPANILVERTMGWPVGAVGETASTSGTSVLSPVWYFAEGGHGAYFDTYLSLLNPSTQASAVTVTCFYESGQTYQQPASIPARARVTLNPPCEGSPEGGYGISVETTNGVPFAAERPMYGDDFQVGHAGAGAPSANQTGWLFAEGSEDSYWDTYFLVLNPNTIDASVHFTFRRSNGVEVPYDLTVPAHSRRVVSTDIPGLSGGFATEVFSTNDVGIVVERSQYWPSPIWQGGHNALGVAGMAPVVTGVAPQTGAVGAAVTLTGSGFYRTASLNRVVFNTTTTVGQTVNPTTLTTAVPTGATSGALRVITPFGSASAGDFFVPPAGTSAADVAVTGRLVVNQPLTITIPANRVGLVVFDLPVGSRMGLKLSGATIFSSAVTVRRPNGQTLASSSAVGSPGEFLEATIPSPGTYSVTVDPYYSYSGNITLTLYDIPPDITGSIVPGGSAVTVSPSTPGQNVGLSFTGVAGQRVSLRMTGVTIAQSYISIVKPDGANLLAPTWIAGYVPPAFDAFQDTLTLPASGSYILIVNPYLWNTGNMTLTLYNVVDLTETISPASGGVTVSLPTPGQNASLTFTGAAGQRVSVGASGSTFLQWYVSIARPDGTALVSPTLLTGSTGWIETITLPSTGDYTLKVDPFSANTGSVVVTLFDVPADTSGSITPGGSPVSVAIAAPGQNAQLSFTGAASQRVSLGLTAHTFAQSYVSIRKPDGTNLVAPWAAYSGSGFIDAVTLPTAGVYTIVVDPYQANTGGVTLTLYDASDVTGSVVVNDPSSVVLTTTSPGQNMTWTFSGTSGQTVTVRFTSNSTGPYHLTGSLLDAAGTTLRTSASYGAFNLTAYTLPATGVYTVKADPYYTGVGSVGVRVTSP